MASSGASTTASNKRRLLLLLVAGAVLLAPASARRRPVRLRVYMHDIVGGPGQTAALLVRGPGPENPSMHPGNYFGDTVAVDDLLTEGLAAGSAPVGRAQGLYMGSDQARLGFLQAMNLVFTSGAHNGSTLALLGRNCPLDAVRELPVVGGTGAFRFARGYALLRTRWLDARTGDATVEYDVYVMH